MVRWWVAEKILVAHSSVPVRCRAPSQLVSAHDVFAILDLTPCRPVGPLSACRVAQSTSSFSSVWYIGVRAGTLMIILLRVENRGAVTEARERNEERGIWGHE